MKICMPVEEYRGFESRVFGHFGSAPAFALVDTETMTVEAIANRDEHHAHGQCSPLRAIGGRQVNVVVVGGIGPGAIRGLQQAGIQVCRFTGGTVAEAVQAYRDNALPTMNLQQACGGHAAGHSCHEHGA